MGLAPSVREAALESGSNIRKLGEFAYFTLFIPFGQYQFRLRRRNEQAHSSTVLSNIVPFNELAKFHFAD